MNETDSGSNKNNEKIRQRRRENKEEGKVRAWSE
jgi:hypothetical protein